MRLYSSRGSQNQPVLQPTPGHQLEQVPGKWASTRESHSPILILILSRRRPKAFSARQVLQDGQVSETRADSLVFLTRSAFKGRNTSGMSSRASGWTGQSPMFRYMPLHAAYPHLHYEHLWKPQPIWSRLRTHSQAAASRRVPCHCACVAERPATSGLMCAKALLTFIANHGRRATFRLRAVCSSFCQQDNHMNRTTSYD